MRIRPVLAALLLGGCGVQGPAVPVATADRPVRVMSLNQCTDQLVLALLPPQRIASVTWLSRDPRFSAQAAAAMRVRVNRGALEEVVRARPDLIVTDTFSNPSARALLHRLGYPMIEVADASDVEGIRRNVRQVAAAVGERARGEATIARMDRALVPDRPIGLRVAAWDRDGMGSGLVFAAVLHAAGLRDVATTGGGVEALLSAAPDLIVDRADASPSLGDDRARHPLVRRFWGADRRLRIDQATLFCATPAIGDAIGALRAQLRARRA